MSLVSVIIPSRNERFLVQTVQDVLQHATGDVEVIAVLDGYWPDPPLPDHPNLRIVHFGESKGMRAAINAGAAVAKGEYLMKTDGHCSFSLGFDEVLKADCDNDWMVIPRRDRLDPENWCKPEGEKRPPIDLHYLSCPITSPDGYSMHGHIWPERDRERKHIIIDETMSTQGSCYFMTRKHWDRLGGLSEFGYGTFAQEPTELGMKTWLGGGKMITNKGCVYLHLHKGSRYGRMYSTNRTEIKAGHYYSAKYWMNDEWKERTKDISWLVEHFWPIPGWPDDWQERRNEYVRIDI